MDNLQITLNFIPATNPPPMKRDGEIVILLVEYEPGYEKSVFGFWDWGNESWHYLNDLGVVKEKVLWYAYKPEPEMKKKRFENCDIVKSLVDALTAITDNIDNWIETGVPADRETSKRLYDDAKEAIKKSKS